MKELMSGKDVETGKDVKRGAKYNDTLIQRYESASNDKPAGSVMDGNGVVQSPDGHVIRKGMMVGVYGFNSGNHDSLLSAVADVGDPSLGELHGVIRCVLQLKPSLVNKEHIVTGITLCKWLAQFTDQLTEETVSKMSAA
eukprot:4593246-Karenia_brevis.AAC.1